VWPFGYMMSIGENKGRIQKKTCSLFFKKYLDNYIFCDIVSLSEIMLHGVKLLANNDYRILSVIKALKVLKQFSEDDKEFTLTELSNRSGLTKASMLRILTSLESEGFVKLHRETRKYSLGIVLYSLGNTAFGFLDIKKICYPILKQASLKTKQIAHLAVIEEDQIVVIDRMWPNNGADIIGFISKIGGTVPLHSTGVGKVLAAYAPKPILNKLINFCDFQKYSERTMATKEDFLASLGQVLAQGYAINDGEHESFLKCVTRPIFNREGDVVAAFSLSGLREVFSDEFFDEINKVSIDVAAKLSSEFGFKV